MMKVWMRMGNESEYESHDSMFKAGRELGGYFDYQAEVYGKLTEIPSLLQRDPYSVTIEPFVGRNSILLFWGDENADLEKKLTQADIANFKAGIKDGAYLFLKAEPKKPSAKRKSTKRSSSTPTSIRGMK